MINIKKAHSFMRMCFFYVYSYIFSARFYCPLFLFFLIALILRHTILILLRDLLMLFDRVCLLSKPKIACLASPRAKAKADFFTVLTHPKSRIPTGHTNLWTGRCRRTKSHAVTYLCVILLLFLSN
jgi:hypothetical protein